MKKLILFCFLFMPFFVFADIYQDVAGTSQMIADSFDDIFTYFFDDVPSLVQRFFGWAIVWFVKAKIYLQLELIHFSWGIAKVIIADLNIMSQITAQISYLPNDVKQALIDMRLFDGLNIVFHAFVTRFVMDLMS